MLSKEEIEFRSSLEKMFNYLKTKKELTEFEKLVIINFDFITKKVLSNECKTATEIVAKNMYYELVKRKEEYYEKQIDQLESNKQKLIEKLEEDIKDKEELIKLEYERYKEYYARTGGYPNQMKFNVFKLTGEKNKTEEILSILKGENHEKRKERYDRN